jgi:prepilin-type N-terminal cleavage/methylation domain-containing protein
MNLSRTSSQRSGFTLIEVLVSLSVFLILIGVLMGSFFQLYKSQHDANEVRKVVADLRTLVNFVQDEMRTKTVDFCGYSDDPSGCRLSFDTPRKELYLVNKDATEATVITFKPSSSEVRGGGVSFQRKTRVDTEHAWSSDGGEKLLSVAHISLKDLQFSLAPMGSPNGNPSFSGAGDTLANLRDSTLQMQPSVTLHVTFGNNYYLQTTFSSRVY